MANTNPVRVKLDALTAEVNKRLKSDYHRSTISSTRNGNGGNPALEEVIRLVEEEMIQAASKAQA